MRTLALALVAVVLLIDAPTLEAQDVGASPTYGDVSLDGGFMPDPHVIEMTAGGSIEPTESGCEYGYVADAPDLDLYYSGDDTRPPFIYARASEDVTLLVNQPDGSWVCDDDSLGDRDPLVIIKAAQSGLFDIWVGTYGSDVISARLYISELDPR